MAGAFLYVFQLDLKRVCKMDLSVHSAWLTDKQKCLKAQPADAGIAYKVSMKQIGNIKEKCIIAESLSVLSLIRLFFGLFISRCLVTLITFVIALGFHKLVVRG